MRYHHHIADIQNHWGTSALVKNWGYSMRCLLQSMVSKPDSVLVGLELGLGLGLG